MDTTEFKLSLIAEHAKGKTAMQFTSLAHLLNAPFLRRCFMSPHRNKAVGHDKQSWYEANPDANLESLLARLKSKSYRSIPARRVYIPKGEGASRPLGISAIENKIVERGIRWILVKNHTDGFCELVRYADDFVCVVQYARDAARIERALQHRFERFSLEIHPEKSNRISFGRYEALNASKQGRRANTFDFLGFTHFCARTRTGRFKLGHKTSRKKSAAKCKDMNQWLKGIRNKAKVKEWWPILSAKLRGHFQYYGVSGNYAALAAYYHRTLYNLRKWLNRRSQKRSMNWTQFYEYLEHYPLSKPEIVHNFYTGFPCHVRSNEEPDVGNPQVRFCEER